MADISLKVLETERRYVARELHDGVAQTTQHLVPFQRGFDERIPGKKAKSIYQNRIE